MAKKNNVDVEILEKTVVEFRKDPAKRRKTQRVEGRWNFQNGMPQFNATLSFEGGTLTLEADQPTAQGGAGLKPGPVSYCLYGLASCFTATFASVAAMEGVELKELKVVVEADVNFSKVFGLSEDPIIEKVRINLAVKSDAPEAEIRRLENLAAQRCPAVFCMTNVIPFETTLTYQGGK